MPIPPLKKLINSGCLDVVFCVLKEVDNEVIKGRVMEAGMLLLPNP